MSSTKSLLKRLEKIESSISDFKSSISELKSDIKECLKSEKSSKRSSSKSTKKEKPASIYKCKNKADLSKFTVKELKDWVKENGVDAKKLAEKLKNDLINLVWKKLKSKAYSSDESENSSSDSSNSSDSSDSGSDSDSSSLYELD